ERRAAYPRHARAPSLLAKSILEGYRPIPTDPYLGAGSPLPPPVSDRMRKRRAFADKELENIMLEREYKEREMMEATQAAALFLPNRVVPGPEYGSYKAAFNPAQVDAPGKEFCSFLPTCLDLTMQYSGSGNTELISSNVSVAATYRQYPLPARFLVWPKCSPIGDALLYQQCLLNAGGAQALKPGAGWDAKASSQGQDGAHGQRDMASPKVEHPLAPGHARDATQLCGEASCLPQEARERSAFSPPKRTFDKEPPEQIPGKLSRESPKAPPLKYHPLQPLFPHAFPEKPGAAFAKETLEEAARKYREGAAKESQKCKFAMDKYAKDLLGAKQAATKLSSSEPLSFSVESILK
ncbi:DMRT2 factor, partial [Crypturellus soui]|nr:DMRT2 factor [Crypturellus soui]